MARPDLAPVACLALVALALTEAPAAASSSQESIVQDDRQLLYAGPAARDAALGELAALGADTVRALVLWNRVAPSPTSIRRPAGLDASDPAAYGAAWSPYSGLVSAAAARGVRVLLTPTGPGPAWASSCLGSATARQPCRPRPAEFRRFVTALARRFPRQHRWALWNEPNVGIWLSPQFSGTRPVSPDLYRSLARAGLAGLHDAGHAADAVLLGETASSSTRAGGDAHSMATLTFVDRLFCMDGRGARVRSGACGARFSRLDVSAFAMHPYTRGGSAGPAAPVRPSDVTIATVGRLVQRLDRAARLGRVRRALPIDFTEYGFQTNPPDRLLGISLSAQATFINQADWLAFREPRVSSVAQYLLRDDANVNGFQSGLRFVSGLAKPSLGAYRLPIWVRSQGSSVTVFGQVRPASGGERETVLVEHRRDGRGFRTVARVKVTNRKGFFTKKVAERAGQWRLSWTPAGGNTAFHSREATASTR